MSDSQTGASQLCLITSVRDLFEIHSATGICPESTLGGYPAKDLHLVARYEILHTPLDSRVVAIMGWHSRVVTLQQQFGIGHTFGPDKHWCVEKSSPWHFPFTRRLLDSLTVLYGCATDFLFHRIHHVRCFDTRPWHDDLL